MSIFPPQPAPALMAQAIEKKEETAASTADRALGILQDEVNDWVRDLNRANKKYKTRPPPAAGGTSGGRTP